MNVYKRQTYFELQKYKLNKLLFYANHNEPFLI